MARRGLWEQIRAFIARGKSVLLTTHHLEEADALADRIVVIDRGAIVAEGTPSEIKARSAGRKIRCTTRLTREVLLALPGVTAVNAGTRDREPIELLTSSAEATIGPLLALDPN